MKDCEQRVSSAVAVPKETDQQVTDANIDASDDAANSNWFRYT